MSTEVKKPKTTKAELERKIMELKSQLAYTASCASFDIDKAGKEKMMASGVIITMYALGGRELIPPTCIRDGLSKESIEALREDFRQSYIAATMMNPKPAEKSAA